MKTKIRKNTEIPSSILVKATMRDADPSIYKRVYWNGSTWVNDMNKAKKYFRAEAEKKAKKKNAFVITTGFVNH